MKIVHLTDKHPGQGGLGRHVDVLRGQLESRGLEVEWVYVGDERQAAANRIPISYGYTRGRRARRTLDQLLQRAAPDVVHLHAGFTTLGAQVLAGVRERHACVGTLHDVRPFCFHADRWFRPAQTHCERRCGAACLTSRCLPMRSSLRALRMVAVEGFARAAWAGLDAVVAPSQYVKDLALAHGFAPERTHVIRHFVAMPVQPAPAGAPAANIACVGTLLPKKGVDLLLRALAQLRHTAWSAQIVGDGPERAGLEALCRSLGLQARVQFLGSCMPEQRDAILAASLLAVMPSQLPESLSLTGLEALAMARPVIGFGLGGTREWLHHEVTGLVAPTVDDAALARQIERLLADPLLARRLGAQGRALVEERFCAAETTDRLVQLYRAVKTRRQAQAALL